MKKSVVPKTKLSEKEIQETISETSEERFKMNPSEWCRKCTYADCDHCKNALRTGKRRI